MTTEMFKTKRVNALYDQIVAAALDVDPPEMAELMTMLCEVTSRCIVSFSHDEGVLLNSIDIAVRAIRTRACDIFTQVNEAPNEPA